MRREKREDQSVAASKSAGKRAREMSPHTPPRDSLKEAQKCSKAYEGKDRKGLRVQRGRHGEGRV